MKDKIGREIELAQILQSNWQWMSGIFSSDKVMPGEKPEPACRSLATILLEIEEARDAWGDTPATEMYKQKLLKEAGYEGRTKKEPPEEEDEEKDEEN